MRHRNSREIGMRDKESRDWLEARTIGRQSAAKYSKDRAHNGEMVARDPKRKSRLSCWSTCYQEKMVVFESEAGGVKLTCLAQPTMPRTLACGVLEDEDEDIHPVPRFIYVPPRRSLVSG